MIVAILSRVTFGMKANLARVFVVYFVCICLGYLEAFPKRKNALLDKKLY